MASLLMPRQDAGTVYRPSLDDPNAWVPYRYIPSLPAAIVFVVCFALATAYHVFKMIKLRSWFFVPFVLGGLSK